MNKKPAKKISKSKRPPGKLGRNPLDIDELRIQIFYKAPKGLNDENLCKFLNISHDTFYRLKKDNSDFSEAIKHYKRISPMEVLASFKKIAVGYSFDEVHKELQKNKSTGEMEMVTTQIVTKHIAANPTAGIFYLKNQFSEEFKDKIETTHSFAGTLENITFVIEARNGQS